MAKLEKIQEACEAFVLKANVSILEESATGNISDLDLAKSRLVIHENIKFIKGQLIQGGILESAQNLLANAWTERILEDMSLADMVDSGQEYANKVAGGAQYLGHGIAGSAGNIVGAIKGGNTEILDLKHTPEALANITKVGYEQGYQPNANISDTYKTGEFIGEHPGVAAAGLGAAGLAAGAAGAAGASGLVAAYPATKQAVKNQVGAAAAGYNGVAGPAKPGTSAAYNAGAMVGKVKRMVK